jgi:hypothetical protein
VSSAISGAIPSIVTDEAALDYYTASLLIERGKGDFWIVEHLEQFQ